VTDSADSIKNLPQERTIIVNITADSVSGTNLNNPVYSNASEHIVQAGETLYGIARQYKVGVMDLVNWNNLNLQEGIKPGQVIKLSDPLQHDEVPETTAEMNLVHEVKATDTVYSIARKYGVTIKDLMEWNNKRDFNLAVGEKLKIIKK
jgi:membrane-bound lytic murein transglycosylase D